MNTTQKLPINDSWILSSLLQKAIRGDLEAAGNVCARLHALNQKRMWRRILLIAFEDIGIGDLRAIGETTEIWVASSAQSHPTHVSRALDMVRHLAGSSMD